MQRSELLSFACVYFVVSRHLIRMQLITWIVV